MNLKVLSWALYDLANTAYSAIITSIFLPVLITIYMGGNEFQLGLVSGISLLLAGILVPIMGSYSDVTQRRKPFLILFTLITVTAAAFIPFLPLMGALALALIGNIFYHASLDIYDSYIPLISKKKDYGHVSGIGIGFGYVGTILSIIVVAFVLQYFGWQTKEGIQMVFIATAIFYLFFSLFLFIFVKDKPENKIPFKETIKTTFARLKHTLTGFKGHKNIWKFLIASLIYTDALNTVIIFFYLFGRNEISNYMLTVKEFLPIYVAMSVFSIFGALAFGKLSDNIGPKKSLITILLLWCGVITTFIINTTFMTYILGGMLGGALLGGTWACTRPMLIKISPPSKLTELFGFQGLTEKLGGVFGPIIFGALVVMSGYQAALISLLVIFGIGLGVLLFVREEEAQIA